MIASARPILARKDIGAQNKIGRSQSASPFFAYAAMHPASPRLIGYSEVMVCVRSTDVWIFARHTR